MDDADPAGDNACTARTALQYDLYKAKLRYPSDSDFLN